MAPSQSYKRNNKIEEGKNFKFHGEYSNQEEKLFFCRIRLNFYRMLESSIKPQNHKL